MKKKNKKIRTQKDDAKLYASTSSVCNGLWRWSIVSFVMMTSIVAGCAKERDAIDRVQPNYYPKSYFLGEWYYQRTVVDVPAANGFTFVGSTDHSGMSRVTFDLQENYLFVRRETELLEDGDSRARRAEAAAEIDAALVANADDDPNNDVNYAELNALYNDDYEGEVIAAFRIQSHFDIVPEYNPSTGERLNIIGENTSDRDWFERDYIRVDWSQNLVTNYNLDFEAASIESIPYFVQQFDNETGLPNRDAPLFEEDYFDITSRIFAKSGTIDYPGYGPLALCYFSEHMECGASEYGIRHSFKKIDPNHQYEELPYKGIETEMFGYFVTDRKVYTDEGIFEQNMKRFLNRHNLWEQSFYTDTGRKIPYANRELKPIVYHVNRDWPVDDVILNQAAELVADQWNDVFVEAVESMGKELETGERAFILCPHNPVREGDPEACGEAGTSPRIGDLRYSFMAMVPDYMTYGLLGLGPSNNDPETGEIVSGMAYVYHHNNLAAHRVLEMIELLNGTRSQESFIDGVDLTQWVEQVRSGEGNKKWVGLDHEHGSHFVHTMTQKRAEIWDGRRKELSEQDLTKIKELGVNAWIESHLDGLERTLGKDLPHADISKISRIQGTPLEHKLIDPELLILSGLSPEMSLSEDVLEEVSPIRKNKMGLMLHGGSLLEELAERRNAYLPSMADDALMGLAREFAGASLTSEEIYDQVRLRIYTAVLAHEVGHSIGLQHNFGASDDAMNYFDQYWAIRDDGNIGPRAIDPITQDEIDQSIYNYGYSSIMDYAGRYTIDGAGIGKYDRAAILYGYAQKVEVFNNDYGLGGVGTLNSWFSTSGDVVNFTIAGPRALHYTDLYETMNADLYNASNRSLVDVADMNRNTRFAQANDGRYRVPYIFCSHTQANISDSCLTRDFGADAGERMKNIMDDLDTWYIARNFPRGRSGVDQYGYVNRWMGRTYSRLKDFMNLYALYADFLPQFYPQSTLDSFFNDPVNGWGQKTLAVQNAFNYLMQTIMMPDVGPYGQFMKPNGLTEYQHNFNGGPTLGVTDARYYSTDWSRGGPGARDCGYYWFECLHHVGFYLDKMMAVVALSDSSTNFVARATPKDIREWEVSFYSLFPEQIKKMNTAIMSQDFSFVGPRLSGGEVLFPDYSGDLTTSSPNVVEPAATFTVQLYWQLLGQIHFADNYDVSFNEESNIFVLGTGDAPELDAQDLITYKDPITKQTFAAFRFGGEGAGEQMIARANQFVSMSSMCDPGGDTLTSDDDCTAPLGGFNAATYDNEVRNWNEIMKNVIEVNTYFGFGNPFSP